MKAQIIIRTQSIERRITSIRQELDDFRPLWHIVRREWLIDNILNIFATDGKGTWLPTSRPNPILRDTRRLFRSYTQPGAPGNINEETRNSLAWGSDVFYAQYHEFDDRAPNLPVRTVIGLLTGPAEQLALQRLIERWVSGVVRRNR